MKDTIPKPNVRNILPVALLACLLGINPVSASGSERMEAIRRLELGKGGVYNPAKAAWMYCSAAKAGNAEAAFALGRLYLAGRGVRKNAAMGAAWLKRAARLGKREAARLVPQVRGGRLPEPSCRGVDYYVRKVEPPPAIAELAETAAKRYDLDPAFVLAVMQAESAYDPRALSPKGAKGLMQLMPLTASRFGVDDPYDPEDNIMGGTAYLRTLVDRYDGDVALVVAAYNAGESAVDEHGGIPPFPETIGYVQIVRTLYPEERLD